MLQVGKRYSFKIKFSEYIEDQTYYGLDILNLNNMFKEQEIDWAVVTKLLESHQGLGLVEHQRMPLGGLAREMLAGGIEAAEGTLLVPAPLVRRICATLGPETPRLTDSRH